jgi:hypothetical protein
MKFEVPSVLHESPTKAEWKARYPENGMRAKLAYLSAKKVYIRNRLAEAQNWRCCWCTTLTVPEPNRKNSATIEHVTPRCEGGADHPDNYAMSCSDCNNKRGTKPIELFMEIMEGRRVEYHTVQISNKARRRLRKAADQQCQNTVLDALQQGLSNTFPEGSKEHRMFRRYRESAHISEKLAA